MHRRRKLRSVLDQNASVAYPTRQDSRHVMDKVENKGNNIDNGIVIMIAFQVPRTKQTA